VAREYPSVLELVGNTPIVRSMRSAAESAELLAKLEYLNPGGSVKDRIGLAMIEKAERKGSSSRAARSSSRPPATPASASPSPRAEGLPLHLRDARQDEPGEDLDAARYGAEVVICPTAVEHDSPESYYSVSDRLAEEIPGGFKPDQYSNMSNPRRTTASPGPRSGSRPAASSTRS
jgi:cystathionine beta-synthase